MGFPYIVKRYGLIALLIVLPGFARAGNSEKNAKKVPAYTSVFKCHGGIWKRNYTDRQTILGTACQAAACQRENLRAINEAHQDGAVISEKKTKAVAHPENRK